MVFSKSDGRPGPDSVNWPSSGNANLSLESGGRRISAVSLGKASLPDDNEAAAGAHQSSNDVLCGCQTVTGCLIPDDEMRRRASKLAGGPGWIRILYDAWTS